MKTFKVSYISLEGDLCHVTVEAYTKEDARIQLKREYWDVREIVRIQYEPR
jgi:type II secretory pathway component PulF